ncbi:1-aminocyclopropane-1-carboxylate deaminase/D-cysteine desulfhydrase [Halotalea alkalilenta]|uniref:Pyridoxal-5'-phosphate-dependent protein n=1 Tax=Halotalea alkalilenta TaxID=376489 RepID=A0A172YAP4_9GAMM|nr:D-cysteine desulfhydrase family protein [Halotalea alkalilenta]ANF56321.1 pyridoxal-5'-phosphate-dependent protein [Halotalea alkalilenta]
MALSHEDFARVELGFLPTPIDELPRLSAALGVDVRMKRDDYTGFGGGGNKVRKLEYLLAEARAAGAEVLITTGGHQSNHARMVAAAARRFGLEAVLVLRGNAPQQREGNLLLDELFGATIEYLDPQAYFEQVEPCMQAHAERAREQGKVPFIIPLGGATPLGALGYVRAVAELAEQYARMQWSPPDIVLAPAGSGGTLAGLIVGARLYWPQTKVIGVSVSRDAAWFQSRIAAMASDCAELLEQPLRFAAEEIQVEDGYVGPGYGLPSDDGVEAIHRLAKDEGILLDPVYTGKAMSALIDLCAKGRIAQGQQVLFVHCGGSPALYPFSERLLEGRRQ